VCKSREGRGASLTPRHSSLLASWGREEQQKQPSFPHRQVEQLASNTKAVACCSSGRGLGVLESGRSRGREDSSSLGNDGETAGG